MIKTLEDLKKDMDKAYIAYEAARDALGVAKAAWGARKAYEDALKELKDKQ